MIEVEFKKFWNSNFNQTIPLSYLFKEVYHERWLRFHSLPDSKRYPESDIEMNIILQRYNQIFSEIYNENEEIYLVHTNITHNDEKFELLNFHPELNFKKSCSFKLEMYFPNDFDNDAILEVFVSRKCWNLISYNEILKEIVNDISRFFFISLDSKIIVAPYDGGIDIILKSETDKAILTKKYKNWISKRIDKL
ncbi:MAG: hypothetical protein RSE15_01500 [Flavobacterium sp.]|jgi:hypothetical protein|uniref:DUF3885 domain-containing protein n=1 Tax=Flavobacterium sp. TaxID=239 RepID=UPI002979ABA3|nr:hypothetical protein [Flavobacterium sp.]TAF09466.1 MAG: hypothetical protein EAZ75_08030 [Flavobacteriia bacterium]WRH73518.1 MAG: hypothetical protein RSE15_01500 [Flavobacterium sp.]